MSHTTTINNNASKVVDHSDVKYSRDIIDKLISGVSLAVDKVVYSVDNSRAGYECSTSEFTDSFGRAVTMKTTIRARKFMNITRVAVTYPQTYKDYHAFVDNINKGIDQSLTETYIEFFNSAMQLTHRNWIFESDSDVVDGDGYYTFAAESKDREYLLQVSIDIVSG